LANGGAYARLHHRGEWSGDADSTDDDARA
jgi:hypothetical protein